MTDGSPPDAVTVEVRRSHAGAPSRFQVVVAPPLVLVDVLAVLQRDHDGTFGFRYSCRAGRCGTCAVRLDGRPVLACQTPIEPGAAFAVEPLGGLPVVADLIVDMTPFLAKWAAVVQAAPAAATPLQDPAERAAGDAARDCIACGACFTACPMTAAGRTFLGPAALTRAAADRGWRRRRQASLLQGPAGVAGCHSVGACSAVCPRGLDPASVIRALRARRGTAS